MGNQIQTFTSQRFGKIRTINEEDRVLFSGRDIASALGYANTKDALARHCKGVVKRYPLQTSGGIQQARFITEGDVYRLIISSKLPAAEQFETWVFDEVLPAIRKHGLYAISDVAENPEMLLTALQALIAEKKRWEQLEAQNLAQAQLLLEASPKLSYYEKVLRAPGAVAISKIAKDYGMSARHLNKLLHDLGIQYKQGDQWLLYQEHAANGYTKSETGTSKDGHVWMHTKWTQAGRLFIYDLLKNRCGILPVIEREGRWKSDERYNRSSRWALAHKCPRLC